MSGNAGEDVSPTVTMDNPIVVAEEDSAFSADEAAQNGAGAAFENEGGDATEPAPSEPTGNVSPRSPMLHPDTVNAIRTGVNTPGRMISAAGGAGWGALRAGVVVAAKARPQLDEEDLLARHQTEMHRPLWIIDPRSGLWQICCLIQGLIIFSLMFWVPFQLCFICMDVLNECTDIGRLPLLNAMGAGVQTDGSDGAASDCHHWDGPSPLELHARNFIDLMILADFVMHFFLGFSKYDLKRRRPVWIWMEATIAKHYMSTPGFLYDLVGAMPIDTILRMEGTPAGHIASDIASILRLARLQSVFEITEPLHRIILRAAVFFPPIDPISKMFMLILTIVGITHLMACSLYFIGHPYFDDVNMCNEHGICGWVAQQGWQHHRKDGATFESLVYTKYVTALYYASTQITTVGFGDISAVTTLERMFSVFSQMFGGFVFGYVLGNISTLLANENLAATTHGSYMETLHHFMKSEGIPPPLHHKVMTYMEARYPNPLSFDEARLWSELPPTLRGEIAVHRHGHMVEKGTLFQNLEYATLSLLCQRIDLVSFMEGDTVTTAGARADRIFMVKVGNVHIFDHFQAPRSPKSKARGKRHRLSSRVAEDETLIEVASNGDAFSEIAALMPYTQQYSCRCAVYCLICTLTREKIWQLAEIQDDLAKTMVAFVQERRAKIAELCSLESNNELVGTTYNDVLRRVEAISDKGVPPDVDAILGGGISGGVST